MKLHGGMRPQDIVILLYIAIHDRRLFQKEIAAALLISPSEVSESLKRSELSGLINSKTHDVRNRTLIEFIQYGLPYVFPAIPGSIVRGIVTGANIAKAKGSSDNEIPYVWQTIESDTVGIAIIPLYRTLPEASLKNEELYHVMALVDTVRIGHTRGKRAALDELKDILKIV